MISLIAVIGKNRELGKDNKLLWHIPGDLPRFKELTKHHPIIMGRKTFQSIGRPLPDRTNIIVTTDSSFHIEGTTPVCTIEDALNAASHSPGHEEIFVIGGGSLYKQTIQQATRLYLTVVDAHAEADTFFPEYSVFTRIIETTSHTEGGYRFTYLTLEK